ncbi:hypothetical protein PILCRDRAFT_763184 [Piloderma croceum F 1598]|uniref:Protein kinase domain-containing protein n=1 Tax=Piloderma croceum (strain F 1598) TaxID=765440 RepID=A0A0C3CP94_PILCF|nr:hypothetical protein PILCRDRAFT_763184 [Piloderma croceum F 1598]
MTLEHILKLDVKAFDALLFQSLQDRSTYRQLVVRCGQEAQFLLNLLQAVCLQPSLEHFPKRALIKLSRTSGLYPECMTLKEIKLVGKTALAAGNFGDIWKGLLGGQEICIKVPRVFQRSDKVKLLKAFSTEAVIWRQLCHPNVLPFYGVFHLEDKGPCLASPWMKNGNVTSFLKLAPETRRLPLASQMLDIAEGLHYLHTFEPSIIHGDLKGVNILITDSHRACLADFGLATTKDSKSFVVNSTTTMRVAGTLRWQAPELFDPCADDTACVSSLASDVYAFACVCYEMFSGEVPFHDIRNDYRVMNSVMLGKRPTRPSHDMCGLDDEIWCIIESCWTHKPIERLTTHKIVERLRLLSTTSVERPIDNFDPLFPSQTLYSQAEHPFSALPNLMNAAK